MAAYQPADNLTYKWYLVSLLLILSVYPPLRGVFAQTREIEIKGYPTSTPPPIAPLIAPQPQEKALNEDSIKALVLSEARKAGVNPKLALWIANRESQLNPEAVGDDGTSFGLYQIHLPAHPDITKASATDPYFATSWAMQQILAGRVSMWSTYSMCRLWYEDCPF